MGDAATGREIKTPLELLNLWRRANQNYACRYCGQVAWDVADPLGRLADPDHSRVTGVLHFADSETGQLVSGLNSTAFICANCGLIELVSNGALLKHAAAKGLLDE